MGTTGVGVFPTRTAVEDREVDARLFGTATGILLGAAGAVGAGIFLTMIAFDGRGACVLAEAETLPAEAPIKTPGAGTKVPTRKIISINRLWLLLTSCLPSVDPKALAGIVLEFTRAEPQTRRIGGRGIDGSLPHTSLKTSVGK